MPTAIGCLVGLTPSPIANLAAAMSSCPVSTPTSRSPVATPPLGIASFDESVQNSVWAVATKSVATYNTVVADEAWSVHRPWSERFRDRYDPAVWGRLNRVHAVTNEQREAARRSSEAIKRMWNEYFRDYDFLVLPASPFAALTKAGCTPENRLRILTLTALASIGGYPVLTVPVALPSGLTTGLQVVVGGIASRGTSWVLEKFSGK